MPSGVPPLRADQGAGMFHRTSTMQQRQPTQLFVVANVVAVLLGMAGVIALAVVKSDESSKRYIANNDLPIANTVILCFCITVLLAALVMISQQAGKTRTKTWYMGCVLPNPTITTRWAQGRAAQEHGCDPHQHVGCAAVTDSMPAVCQRVGHQHNVLVAAVLFHVLHRFDLFRRHGHQRRTCIIAHHTHRTFTTRYSCSCWHKRTKCAPKHASFCFSSKSAAQPADDSGAFGSAAPLRSPRQKRSCALQHSPLQMRTSSRRPSPRPPPRVSRCP